MAESKLIQDLIAARRAGVPLLAIETADPASCIKQVRLAFQKTELPLASWDKSDGFKPQNKAGEQALREALGESPEGTYPFPDFCKAARQMATFPANTITFFLNGQTYIEKSFLPEQPENVQAVWNLRDELKKDKRMLIILCHSIMLPIELKHDFIVLEDPLPDTEQLTNIIKNTYKNSNIDEPKDSKIISTATEYIRGLSAFEAENVSAMSMERTGLNLPRLWLKKQKTIEMTPGLRIWKEKITFDDVRGLPELKSFMTDIMNGEDRPTVGVFWDELEKMFAGAKGDLSGVTGEMHGQVLSWMADYDIPAMRYVGHPGCSKSYISKALAGQFGIPLIMMNISELKGSLVGQSTKQLKDALKVITAIGRPLVMATCNNEDALSPELRDRFNLGTWMFDLPTKEEQLAVFDIWMKKLNLKGSLPNDYKNWTQRNIHDCCMLAWRLKKSLDEASHRIVPVYRSEPQTIEARRRQADGRYLSVTKPGVYSYDDGKKNKFQDETIRAIDPGQKFGEA